MKEAKPFKKAVRKFRRDLRQIHSTMEERWEKLRKNMNYT